jgi:AraC-like DNA-binding protein
LERAELLTDLSLATGYGAFLVDQDALMVTGDQAPGRSREMESCRGCSFSAPATCLAHWTVPGESGLARCPGGQSFAYLKLTSEGAPAGHLILGPLTPEAAEAPRQARALISVMEAMAVRMERLGLLARRSELFVRLSRHISEHLTDALTAETLQDVLYASESALAHAVKQETGMSLRLYVQTRRLEAARQMILGTSMTVMQVAEKCGISDFNYFARIFKKRYGTPPSVLRRKESPSRLRRESLPSAR